MKSVRRFCKKGKHSSCFLGQYKIVWRVGKVSYEIYLPKFVGIGVSIFSRLYDEKSVLEILHP